jgi:ABC-type sugar transport system permease subunit
VVIGILLALLLDQPLWGQGIVRILVIAPFFVMPTVSGTGLEKYVYGSGEWIFCAYLACLWGRADTMAITGLLAFLGDDCQLAMAAFCNAYFAHRYPVSGFRTVGSG